MRDLPKNVYRQGKKYVAICRVGQDRRYLGSFATPEEASERARLFREKYPLTRNIRGAWQPGEDA